MTVDATTTGRVICRANVFGKCKFGTSCKFAHMDLPKGYCRVYYHNQTCPNPKCAYEHAAQVMENAPPIPRKTNDPKSTQTQNSAKTTPGSTSSSQSSSMTTPAGYLTKKQLM